MTYKENLPNVKNNHLVLIHEEGGHIVVVLLVPGKPQQGNEVWALVNDSRVLETPEERKG